ncbi:hypothetical protein HKB47_22650 [Mesorhizobium japonicum]|nr:MULTISPECIES: hypothetical protein [Mesorhizobium]ETA72332.1 hypothetical protein MesloDRAFT_1202 [Mesorhizobium japonicum R7A]MBE1709663.1 hypothetical protein [Mesorhizobium japonicum]MBE1714332.1 hypothetical protein [Mesorhizobium japonicum]MUT25313.1 hypothetical protein [Mesorhizobium japonicum]MUT28633.1 hypothetical protein [Mesorhizobium japonicum]
MKITNASQGPRGIHTVEGLRIIPVGGFIEAEVSAVELKGAKETGWFSIEGSKADKPHEPGDAKTAAEVLALADGNFMAFKSAASKLLGDKTPEKKAEIVAALEDLATKPE